MESNSNKRKRNNYSPDGKSLEELKDLVRKLEKENKVLEEKVNEEKKKVNEEKKKGSVYTSLDTLLRVEESKFVKHVKCTGSSTSHKPCNNKATVYNKTISLEELKNKDIGKLKNTRPLSYLLSNFVDPESQDANVNDTNLAKKLKFSSVQCNHEADYTALVRDAAKDAINILKICGKNEGETYSTNMERSLFSVRPDILVVRNSQRLGVLAIEVKKPEEKEVKTPENTEDALFHSKILGQVFDQSEAMCAFGKGSSIVVLTNFLKSSICSVDKSVFEPIEVSRTGQCVQPAGQQSTPQRTVFETTEVSPTVQCVQPADQQSTPHEETSTLPSQSPPKSISPPHIVSSPSHSSLSDVDTAENTTSSSLFMPKKKRIMWKSQSFNTHQLVHLIYTGLLLSLKKKKTAAQETYKLNPASEYHFKPAIEVKVGKKYHRWGELKFQKGKSVQYQQTQFNYTPCPQNTFYIIGELGHGSTSNVFHALTWGGDEVAMKLYLSNIDKGGKVLTKEDFHKQGRAATEMETETLIKLYPFLKKKVRMVELFNGHHAVVMPKFEQIKTDQRNEDWIKANVKPVLERFAENKLKYAETDVQWRHVGQYTDDHNKSHCILYDLAELEKVEDDDDGFVEDHLKKLLRKIPKSQMIRTSG